MNWHEPIALSAAALPAVPLLVLAAECLVALPRLRRAAPSRPNGVRCAVLVPAHDEEAGIAATVAAAKAQLAPGDRLLVVADNCSDGTAGAARAAGADVVERSDESRRGKGYALARGVEELAADPPDAVVVLDADCLPEPGALGALLGRLAATGRPVQAAYLMDPPPAPRPGQQIAAFAFRVKNVARPLGLARLGLPCLLTGTGMAFPWAALRGAKLGHGHIVEDMQLAVDLAAAGFPPVFEPSAVVRSRFPTAGAATASQRKRWEHGHLSVLLGAPRLFLRGVLTGRPALAALALEVGVPPLSALVLATVAALVALAVYGAATGFWLPAALLGGAALLAGGAIFAAWLRFGRDVAPARALAAAPWYAARKLALYAGFLVRPQTAWVRTGRDPRHG